jgi:adenylate cyclase
MSLYVNAKPSNKALQKRDKDSYARKVLNSRLPFSIMFCGCVRRRLTTYCIAVRRRYWITGVNDCVSHLAITLMGTFQVTLDERPVDFATDKARALLAYLALEATAPHRREALSGLFWPERPDRIARSNLRQTLHRLRSAIQDIGNPDPHLLVSHHDVQFNLRGDHWLDVAEFERRLADYRAHCGRGLPLCAQCLQALKAAATLYQGELMAGFSSSGSPDFEFWFLTSQENYHRQALEAISRLGADYEMRGDHAQAADCAQRLVGLEPWRQSFHRLLMRNLALAGQRKAAIEQYARCREVLVEELGIEPSKKTHQLHEWIYARDEQTLRQEARARQERFTVSKVAGEDNLSWSPRSFLPGAGAASSTLSGLFVGREEALAEMNNYLSQALVDRAAIVFIRGEAGSGKSSLAAEFVRRSMAANNSLLAAFGGCDARLGLGDAYQPFREILRQLAGYTRNDSSWGEVGVEAARRLQAVRSSFRQAVAETGPDLPGTLLPQSVSGSAAGRAERQSGLAQVALFEQVSGLLRAVAWGQPLILILDDLHWVDKASASLLFYLGRHLADSHILIIGAYRPEQVGWFTRAQAASSGHPLLPVVRELTRIHGQIEINLDQADGRAFIDALVDSEPNQLGPEFRANLFRHTGGNPLFTVETLRGLQDRGELQHDAEGCWKISQELNWDRVPARVEAIISARFERLDDPCRELLGAASVQGRTFLAEIAAETRGLEAGPAVSWLSQKLGRQHRLVEAGGLEWYDDRSLSRFRFRHFLFQQCAYQQLDPVSRARLHQATGFALEALYAGREEEHALELAGHFQAAGMVEKALGYLQIAGRVAYRLAASETALGHFDQALELLKELPPGPVRDRREMILQLARTSPLLALHGYAAPEITDAANRVVCLAEQLDEPDYLFPARVLLISQNCMLAEYRPALKLADQLLRQAEKDQKPLHLTQAHHFLGHVRFCAGSFEAALEHFDAALAAYDRHSESLLMSAFIGQNIWLTTLLRKAWTLWFLGCPDQSQAILDETIVRVEQLGRDHDLAFTLAMGICPILCIRREFDQAGVEAQRLLELATRKGLSYFIPFGQVSLGTVQAKQGRTAAGQEKIRAGIQAYRLGGQKTFLTYCLSLLADSLGEEEEAAGILDEALALVDETGERFFEAELWRLYGEYLWHGGGEPTEAEECFQRALAIAGRQRTRSLALRAATSLARLWSQQERGDEAAELLGETVSSFNEGFDTPDVEDAQLLLESLHRSTVTALSVATQHE